MNNDVNIYPCGLVVSPWDPWLAVSPDRKVYCPSMVPAYGLLEIKCPVKPLAECQYLTKNENGYRLKENHNYYHQVLMQMAETGIEWCHFLVWTTEESPLELIRFNMDTWKDMKEKLDTKRSRLTIGLDTLPFFMVVLPCVIFYHYLNYWQLLLLFNQFIT